MDTQQRFRVRRTHPDPTAEPVTRHADATDLPPSRPVTPTIAGKDAQRSGEPDCGAGLRTASIANSRLLLTVAVIFFTATFSRADAPYRDNPNPNRFKEAIDAFGRADRRSPPKPGAIVAVGSSSIRMLDEDRFFPEFPIVNRGFGGAHISDVNHFLEQTVLKYHPRTVVLFCGMNDVWYGKPIDQVLEDFREFTSRLFGQLPDCRLLVLAIRPSPRRIKIIETERAMNRLFREAADADDRVTYLPGSCDRFLDPSGRPIPNLYADDQLHMNDRGYRIWDEILTPHLAAAGNSR